MSNTTNKLSDKESARLKELIALKKASKLSDSEKMELDGLNRKCGFKSKKSRGNDANNGFKPGNDFSWWNKLPDLLKDAANYKCNYIAGDPIAEGAIDYIVPGVLAIGVVPSYGFSFKRTDPLNVWSRDLYLKMFQKYRVANGYSAADLGITLLATVELVKTVAWYERVYGVINRYSKLNLNMPFTETRALGLSDNVADYLRSHLSDFRYDLNELISRMQRVTIMKDLSILQDAISLFGYEYLDHESARSQIILFKPAYYGVYNETDMLAGNVRFEPVGPGTNDFDQFFNLQASETENLCTILNEQVSALLGSDSVQKIYADLVTWFGEAAMLEFQPIPDTYIVVPVKSDSILHKLHNAEIISKSHAVSVFPATDFPESELNAVSNTYRIYQYNDDIISGFGFVASTGDTATIGLPSNMAIKGTKSFLLAHIHGMHVLDTYHEDVDVETVTEGVLFKADLGRSEKVVNNATFAAYVMRSCAFEVLMTAYLYKADGTRDHVSSVMNAEDEETFNTAGRLAVIDWAPLSYSTDVTTGVVTEVAGDVDNVVPISLNGLFKLQRTIVYSGLHTDVAVIGK